MKSLSFYKQTLVAAVCLLWVSTAPVCAQQRTPTLEEISGWSLYPRGLNALAWVPGSGAHYSYREENALLIWDAAKNKEAQRIDANTLSAALAQAQQPALKNLPSLNWNPDGTLRFVHNAVLWSYHPQKKTLRKSNDSPSGVSHLDLEPNSQAIAYTRDHNLFVSVAGEERNISQNDNPQIRFGEAAHRQEFGISKGTFWSPQGSALAFYRMDETAVSDIPYPDVAQTPVQNKPFKYPMAGQATHLATLGIYHLKSGERVFLETGDPADTYIACVTWSPDERFIYAALLNREQRHMRLVQFDPRTGKAHQTLFEERNDKYVEPQHDLQFLPNKPNEFLWRSRRDGWFHLYHYRTDGTLVAQLTQGEWEVTDFLGFSADGQLVYFMATLDSPAERHLYSVGLQPTPKHEATHRHPRRITTQAGVHKVLQSPDAKFWLDTYNNLNTPGKTLLREANGKDLRTLHTATNPLADFPKVDVIVQNQRGPDDLRYYTRMLLPPNFDGTRRYPVLLYTYGGPHAQMVTNSWLGGAGLFLYWLAQQGYVVYTLDGRGSAHRGMAWEQATFRNLGAVEREDQMQAVAFLKQQPFVDTTRIGVHGWSFGGYLTASLLLHNPGVFKCGIAGAPVTDWKFYEIMYTERYMDTPQTNDDGYKESSLLEYAGKLKDRLLVVHGTADDVVIWQHTLSFMDACIKAGSLPDYFVYPGHKHHVGGADRLHLHRYMARYLDEHLLR